MELITKEETGFKRTEIGLIPEDWSIVTLEDAVQFLDGKRRPVKSANRARMKGKYPYYGASGIIDYVDDYIFDDNLILLGEDGENILSRSVRLAFTVEGKIWVNNHAHVLKPLDEFDIDFLAEYLESLNYEIYNSGTAQPKLNKNACKGIPVLKPTLSEQKAIATALSEMDDLIAGLEKLIAKKKAIKQGAMQQLLTPPSKGGKRLPGFSGDWEEKRLGEIGNTYGGLTGKGKADFNNGNYKYITFLNVMNNIIIDNSMFEMVNIKPGETQNQAKKGDLFFNTSSETPEEVGMCAVILDEIENLHLNSFCFGFRLIDLNSIDPLFISYLINSEIGRKFFLSLAQGATRYNLSKSNFNKIVIEIPQNKQEQNAITSVLFDMDKEIEALELKRTKFEQIKQGMMQELLTGKTRLV